MPHLLDEPVFVFTSDIDWASESAIQDTIDFYRGLDAPVHIFATHASEAVNRYWIEEPANVGIHPNFLPGSSHGNKVCDVLDYLLQTFPGVTTSRSHHFFDSSSLVAELSHRGFRLDSNLCLWLEPDLRPLALGAGRHLRYPVFWEDDVHWTKGNGFAKFADFVDTFFTPGLKILNTHPFSLYLNIGAATEYTAKKYLSGTVNAVQRAELLNTGYGVRSFITDLSTEIRKRGAKTMSLDQVHRHLYETDQSLETSGGRNSSHSRSEFEGYLNADDASKQEFVRRSYDKRRARDIYATSRDFHLRELEIEAIRRSIPKVRTDVLDLGCGNGYTILELAKTIEGARFVGVDFSQNLIDGANHLRDGTLDKLGSSVEYVCADALEYVAQLEDGSVPVLITERFVLNLPSPESQLGFLSEVERVLEPNGVLLMCEGFSDGFDSLNALRVATGLDPIPDKAPDNVSSLKLDNGKIRAFFNSNETLAIESQFGFSQYMTISRVLHPLLVAPARPTYDAKVNDLARKIQIASGFGSGVGSNELWVVRKRKGMR